MSQGAHEAYVSALNRTMLATECVFPLWADSEAALIKEVQCRPGRYATLRAEADKLYGGMVTTVEYFGERGKVPKVRVGTLDLSGAWAWTADDNTQTPTPQPPVGRFPREEAPEAIAEIPLRGVRQDGSLGLNQTVSPRGLAFGPQFDVGRFIYVLGETSDKIEAYWQPVGGDLFRWANGDIVLTTTSGEQGMWKAAGNTFYIVCRYSTGGFALAYVNSQYDASQNIPLGAQTSHGVDIDFSDTRIFVANTLGHKVQIYNQSPFAYDAAASFAIEAGRQIIKLYVEDDNTVWVLSADAVINPGETGDPSIDPYDVASQSKQPGGFALTWPSDFVPTRYAGMARDGDNMWVLYQDRAYAYSF